MKIVTIVGARPQFIKAAVVSNAIEQHNKTSDRKITEIIVHTGQHYDPNMSDVFFEEMKIPHPKYNLNVQAGSHGAMTGQMLEKIEQVLMTEKPDWVLVYGDTNSTLAGALAAQKLHIKVAHVEAGLRSFNMKMPEEINRIITDRISNILFCPTKSAVKNLDAEGFSNFQAQIVQCGDVMYDVALHFKKLSKNPFPSKQLGSKFVLCTIHRAENTNDQNRMREILKTVESLADQIQFVIPIHPRTRKTLENFQIGFNHPNIIVCDPLGYLEMLWLLEKCSLVMTDSGGLQKEAYFFKKPCVTLRDETEWVELVEAKVNILAGANGQAISSAFKAMLGKNITDQEFYGSGDASKKIISSLLNS